MRIVLLGAPGAGKGTQGEWLSHHLNMPRISTGEMLRLESAAGTVLGQQVEKILSTGQLVEDALIMRLIEKRLTQSDCQAGCLFDGFPRTVAQAESLAALGMGADLVIDIDVPDAEIIQRLTGRRVHLPSGRTYHVNYHPPKIPDCDDLTGEPLVQRSDDQAYTIQKRLSLYHQYTEPLITWYQNKSVTYLRVDGTASIETVRHAILNFL